MTIPPISDFDDLLVHVIERDADRQTYLVKITLEDGRNFSGQMDLEDYQDPMNGNASLIATYGINLFNRLFTGLLADAFRQAWSAAQARKRGLRFRLRLDSDNPLLHRIPWELLHYDDSGGLSPPRPLAIDGGVVFSRYLESAQPEGQPMAHRPIRMLAVISEPNDLEVWKLAQFGKNIERRDLENRFSPLVQSGQFVYDILERASARQLHNALEQGYVGEPPKQPGNPTYDILLYYGHALHHPARGTRLLLEDDATGAGQLYDAIELVRGLQRLQAAGRTMGLVVLVACNTATTSRDRSLGNMAADLVRISGVPAVLAMQRLVEIPLARNFTAFLSEQLMRTGIIDIAVNMARQRVFQSDSLSWSTPVLYMRSAKGQIFSPNARLEYIQAVLTNPQFTVWRGPEFIDMEVQVAPPGQDWSLLKYHPEDAPPPASGLRALLRRLQGQEVIGDARVTWLLGAPHSGQTVLLQRLTLDLAEAVIQDVNQPLGLFVSLSGYEQQRGNDRLLRHIIERATEMTAVIGDELRRCFLTPGAAVRPRPRYVFLLDGLDAIPDPYRVAASREIIELAARFSDQQFVVSCSEERFPVATIKHAAVMLLQPLSERQVMQFLRNRRPERSVELFRQIVENRLLALTSDPSLLTMIYQRMAIDQIPNVSRNLLMQDYLDQAFGGVTAHYTLGDIARETLIALAWQSRWQHCEDMTIQEMFDAMVQIRGSRDYNLEDLYQMLSAARLLVSVGRHVVRFVHPALHTYCAALALHTRPDRDARLNDIITMCSSPTRYVWWEDTLYTLAGLLTDPAPLLMRLAAAVRAGSDIHALLVARCLEALPDEVERRLAPELRQQLLDICVLRLRSNREPSAERRAQIVTALGRLRNSTVTQELKCILVDRVRNTSRGLRYEYTNVRIAAARALRTILNRADAPVLTATHEPLTYPGPPELQMAAVAATELIERLPVDTARNGQEASVDDATLRRLMQAWQRASEGDEASSEELRTALASSSAPVRAVAAFALGDLALNPLTARLLLRVILSPPNSDVQRDDDWNDTIWAATDALTLFDPQVVARLLTVLIKNRETIPDESAQQLAYIAGRVRAQDEAVIAWLIELLICNPNQQVKSKALQSLAWLGRELSGRRLPGVEGVQGPTIKQVIEQIAAWRTVPPTGLGPFMLHQTEQDLQRTPLYLRHKAIEALVWIGDRQTLRTLSREIPLWDLELRETWYATAAALEARLT